MGSWVGWARSEGCVTVRAGECGCKCGGGVQKALPAGVDGLAFVIRALY